MVLHLVTVNEPAALLSGMGQAQESRRCKSRHKCCRHSLHTAAKTVRAVERDVNVTLNAMENHSMPSVGLGKFQRLGMRVTAFLCTGDSV